MKIALYFFALVIFCNAQNTTTGSGPWQNRGLMPSPQMHYSSTMFSLNNEIYLFGRPWNVWVNYFWKFTPANSSWTLLSNNVAATPRWFQKGVVYTQNVGNPQPNFFIYSGVADGGIGGNGVPNANWIGDGITYNWNNNYFDSFSPNSPRQRQSPGLEYIPFDNTVWMFGGCLGNPNMNDTLRYSFQTNTWTNINVNVVIPPVNNTGNTTTPLPRFITGRCGHSTVLIESQRRILMFGGHSGGAFLDDLWSYDIDTSTWTLVIPEGIARPTARCYHSAVVVEDIMFLYGGDGPEIRHLDDMWAYSATYNRWITLSPKGGWPGESKLSERAHHSSAAVGNQIFFYGGLTHTAAGANVFLTDLWSYNIGCANNCSGRGVCDKIVCICNNCTGGADCSVDICGPTSTTNENIIYIPAEPQQILLGVILAIVGAIAFIIIASVISGLIIYRKFKKWKEAKEAKQQGMVDLQKAEKPFSDDKK